MKCSVIIYSPHGSGKSAWCGILAKLSDENLLSVSFDPSLPRKESATSVNVYDTDFLSGNQFDQYIVCRHLIGNVDILFTNSINLFMNLMEYFDKAIFVKPHPSEVFVGAQNRYLQSTGESYTGRLATNVYLVSLHLFTLGIKEKSISANKVRVCNDLESAVLSFMPAAVKSRCLDPEFRLKFETPRILKTKLLESSSGYLPSRQILSAIGTVSRRISGFPYRDYIQKWVPLYAKALVPVAIDEHLPKVVVEAVLGEGLLSYLRCASASVALTSKHDGGYYPWMECKLSELHWL